jgi:hypothetical protein
MVVMVVARTDAVLVERLELPPQVVHFLRLDVVREHAPTRIQPVPPSA